MRKLMDFFKKPNSRDVAINTVGNYLNIAFTAVLALILVRILNPVQYGVLSVLLSIAYVLSNVLDFGVTATIYSNLPVLLDRKTTRTYQFIKTIFSFQSILSSIVISILFFAFPYLDKIFFKTGAQNWELYITALSVLFLLWQNFALNILYAAKKFLHANIYNNIQNAVKTLILLFLIVKGKATVGAIIFIFGVLGPIIFFALLFFWKKDLIFILLKSRIKTKELKFGYTLTYFFASQLYNMGTRTDLFLLSFFGLRNEVGYYGLAQKIMLTIVTTVISITQVIAPGFSRIKTVRDARRELLHGFYYLLIPLGLFVLLAATPQFIFSLAFTEKFITTTALTKGLVPAYIVFTLAVLPLQFVLYTIKKPVYVLWGNILFFAVMAVGCLLLIPKIGVQAPIVVNFVAILAPALILYLATLRGLRSLPK